MFQLLDLGLAQTMNREVARLSANVRWEEAGNLLHTLAVVYWTVALCIATIVFLLSGFIADRWIQAQHLPVSTIQFTVQLMGVAIACRWPVGLYQGALNGLQLNTVTSFVAIAMTALGSGGAVLLLAYVSPTIEAFFIWQASVGLVYAATLRVFANRSIPSGAEPHFDFGELRRIWRFTTSVAAIGLSGIVMSQLDKVLLSKIVSLRDFGYYMLATMIAGGLYLITTPMFNVMYPKFSLLVAKGESERLRQLYRVGTRVYATALFFDFVRGGGICTGPNPDLDGRRLGGNGRGSSAVATERGHRAHGIMFFPFASAGTRGPAADAANQSDVAPGDGAADDRAGFLVRRHRGCVRLADPAYRKRAVRGVAHASQVAPRRRHPVAVARRDGASSCFAGRRRNCTRARRLIPTVAVAVVDLLRWRGVGSYAGGIGGISAGVETGRQLFACRKNSGMRIPPR